MADKKYKLTFNLSDGSKQEVEFTAPQGPQGAKGEDGYTPVKGVDYFTEADKAELMNGVLAAMPNAEGVGF